MVKTRFNPWPQNNRAPSRTHAPIGLHVRRERGYNRNNYLEKHNKETYTHVLMGNNYYYAQRTRTDFCRKQLREKIGAILYRSKSQRTRTDFHSDFCLRQKIGPCALVTRWCLCTSRCLNKTHYLVGSHFIDG